MVHAAERHVTALLSPRTVRCRVRAGRIVVELDQAALGALDHERTERLGAELAALGRAAGLEGRVDFAPYRNGSAFIRRLP